MQQQKQCYGDDDDDGIGLNYLDLGTGNASVLHMVLWSCQKHEIPVQMAIITQATIRQGGMPTALASALAQCEFRGGIEAYTTMAAQLLT